jgi:CheY-like chemotaxis protein
MDGYTRSVLVVEADPVERERLSSALEGDGFDVLLCSGPSAPDDGCLGTREGRCPLAIDGSVVVLDMDLDAGAAVEGTSTQELLAFYLGAGHRVVTLSSRPTGLDNERLLELRCHPESDVLLTAVWRSASPAASGHPIVDSGWSRPDA